MRIRSFVKGIAGFCDRHKCLSECKYFIVLEILDGYSVRLNLCRKCYNELKRRCNRYEKI